MTKNELAQAVELARSKEELHDDDSCLYGLYLRGFVPVSTTIRAVARFVRWHCFNIDGTVATDELAEFAGFARKRILIVG
jgi:hypothetical protein